MADRLLIYGASGYTGRLVLEQLVAAGVRPVAAGRDAGRVAAIAAPLGLEVRTARLDDPSGLVAALDGIAVVLHTAGPFSATAAPMLDACIRTGTHYLDVTAEVQVIEALARADAAARRRRIMVMPAVGFDVVPSDCLAAHVVRRLPGARHLAIAVTGLRLFTRGSAKTLAEAVDAGLVRRRGALTPVPFGSLRRTFDFGTGPRPCVNLTWGDLATAYYSTGVPNIETYTEDSPMLSAALTMCRTFGRALRTAAGQAWLRAHMDLLPDGPAAAVRAPLTATVVAAARDAAGRYAVARLHTPEAYTFTAMTAAAIAARVLARDLEFGFQTPSRVFGPDFPLALPGVRRIDLAPDHAEAVCNG